MEGIANGGSGSTAAGAVVGKERARIALGRETIRRAAFVVGTVFAFSALIGLGLKMAAPKPSSKPSTDASSVKAGYVPSFTRTNYDVGSQPDSVVVGDFKGDGKLDVAVANAGDGTVSVLLGRGDGTFQSPMQYAVGPRGRFSQIVAGDFNGDGHLDLVARTLAATTSAYFWGAATGPSGPQGATKWERTPALWPSQISMVTVNWI